jgi:tape measure domain-containing protein
MAVGAGSPELKLSVGFDLAYFRNQLPTLGAAASSYALPINIKFNRLGLQEEFNKLGRNISGRQYNLKVEVKSLETAIKQARELQKILGQSRGQTARATALQGITGKDKSGKVILKADDIRKVYSAAMKAGIEGLSGNIKASRPVIEKELKSAFGGASDNALKGLINGLASGEGDLKKVAGNLGNAIIEELNRSLEIRSPSKKTQRVGEQSIDGLVKGFVTRSVRMERFLAKTISNFAIGAIYEGLSTLGNLAPAFAPLEKQLQSQFTKSFQKAISAGLEASKIPGFKGGLLGLLGGGTTGALIGGAKGLGGAVSGGLSQLGAGGMRGVLSQMGRLGHGDTSAWTSFIQDAMDQALHQAFSPSILGAVIGAAAVGGVAGSTGFVKGAFNSLTNQVIEKIVNTLLSAISGDLVNDAVPVLRAFAKTFVQSLTTDLARHLPLNISFPPMLPALPPAYRGINPAAGPAGLLSPGIQAVGALPPGPPPTGLLPPAYRGIYPAGPRSPLGLLPPAYRGLPPGAMPRGLLGGSAEPFGLLPSITKKSSIASGVESLFAAGGPVFPDEPAGKLALTSKALKARVDLILAEYFAAAGKTVENAFDPRAFKAQLNTFAYLVQALRDAELRTKGLLGSFGRERTYTGRPVAGEGINLPAVSTLEQRLLPPAKPTDFTGTPFFRAPDNASSRTRIRRPLTTGQGVPSGPMGGGAEADAIVRAAQNTLKLNLAANIAKKSFEGLTASQLPLIGGIRSLGGEFANATKQVLLYGTAYRALGFITSLPGQILNAAKSQQQYTNGLKVATQETGTFAKELLFVDNVQRAFGLNLETTRVGFTRLYASMAPTGFDSGSIEKLFTGISAATASLQLTPDKAERVIYAFGQMASKGQIMSEELKGQLGDVLPGALAIFAKAAGMSVKEFSKAMEDGEFVGNRFREVFAKVSDELMNRFGTGAQAAGKSLQGLLNTVGGDFQRTLESFAPLADSAAQAILVPLGGALRQLATSAQIAMGEIDRVREQYKTALGDVRDLRAGGASADQIKAAEQNVSALAARYRSLNQALENPAVAKQVKDIQLFVQELTKAGTFVMNVAQTIGGILAPALNFLGTNLTATIATITSFYIGFQTARLAASALMGVLLLYRGLTALMGLGTVASQATALAGAFNILGVSASGAQVKLIGLRVALTALVATTVVGAVVAGIVAIAGAFATMGNRARDAAQGSREAAKAAMDAASTGNVAGAAMNVQTVLAESRKNELARKTLQRIQARATKEQKKGAAGMRITPEESAALQGSALTSGMITAGVSRGGFREIRALSSKELETRLQEFGSVAGQSLIDLKETKAAFAQAQKVSKLTGQNQPTPGATTLENEATKDKTKAKSLEGYYKLEDDLAKAITDGEIDRANMLFEHRKNLLNTYYDIQDARANSFQKETIKFQREIANIEMDRQKSALDAQNAVKKIQGSVAGGATGLLQGSTGVSSGAHFDVRRQDGKYISPEEARALFDPAIARQLSLTDKYGPRTAPVPGASTFHRGVDLAGPANTPLNLAAGYSMMGAGEKGGLGFTASVRGPQGTMYDVGHLQRPGAGAGAIRPVKGNESRDIKAAAKTEIELQKESLALKYADALAIERQKVAMENYVAAMLPMAEQQLQNQLLEKRIALQLAGTPQALIDREMELYEAETKNTAAIELHRAKIAELSKQKGADGKLTENAVKLMALEQKALDELIAKFPQYKALLQQAGQLKAKGGFASDMSSLRDQIQLAGIIDPRAELRQKLIQEGRSPDQADEQVKLQSQLDFLTKLRDGYRGVADAIGNSFGEAFKGIISGSMTAQQALAGMFQSIADSFLDMVAQMISSWIQAQAIKGFQAIFGAVLSGFGGGIGGGFTGGGGGGFNFPTTTGEGTNFSPNIGNDTGIPWQFANGGIAQGGFRAFASGGIVTGPTLGLVGEGRYNEAVIPLPDGKSVPVDLGGMGGTGGQITSNIVVNVNSDGQSQSQQSGNGNAELGKKIEGAVKQVIVGELRPGGLLAGRR